MNLRGHFQSHAQAMNALEDDEDNEDDEEKNEKKYWF